MVLGKGSKKKAPPHTPAGQPPTGASFASLPKTGAGAPKGPLPTGKKAGKPQEDPGRFWLLFLVVLAALCAYKFGTAGEKIEMSAPLKSGACVSSATHSICLTDTAELQLFKGSIAKPADGGDPIFATFGGQKKGKYAVELGDDKVSLDVFKGKAVVGTIPITESATLTHLL